MSITLAQNFYKETITIAWTTGAGNFYVSTKPTISEGYLVISASSSSLREIVKFTATGTDGNGDYVTITALNRGLGGTTEQSHAAGETVYINITAETLQEISDAIDQIVAGSAQDSSTTTKGISKLSVNPLNPSEPVSLAENDPRVPPVVFVNALTGMIFMYGSSAEPTGFLLCNGQEVSRTTYADLFAKINTDYGIGNGSTTFNVPNLASRFPLGYSASAPTKVLTFTSRSSNVITVTGADNHTNNELQTGKAVLYSAPSGAITGLTHNTTYYLVRVTNTTFSLATSIANANAGTVITLSSDGTGVQTFTITYTVRPIGQKGGEEIHALTDTEMPSHAHTIGLDNGAGGSAAITLQQTSGSGSTSVSGSDTPHNIMPLFTVVNYIIKT